jgi:phosphatidylinositol-3-phosphatase
MLSNFADSFVKRKGYQALQTEAFCPMEHPGSVRNKCEFSFSSFDGSVTFPPICCNQLPLASFRFAVHLCTPKTWMESQRRRRKTVPVAMASGQDSLGILKKEKEGRLMKIKLRLKSVVAMLAAASLVSPAFANEGQVPKGVSHLDHVFVIMMENHGYSQIVGNPDAPFINEYTKHVNVGRNYFAVAHPSLTNYLETVGGSNFGVLNDNSPAWHSSCATNLSTGIASLDNSTPPNDQDICPIWGTGKDAATPAIDYSNETTGPPGDFNIDGTLAIPQSSTIVGKTIADQLFAVGKSWKSYEESLPSNGADFVNNSDGFYTDATDFSSILPGTIGSDVVKLYAVKHNPFVYFQSVQEAKPGTGLGLDRVVGFGGPHGLYDDLESGHVPNLSYIVPNQCNDQHGRGSQDKTTGRSFGAGLAGPGCLSDPNDNGTQTGLNPALIYQGDLTLRTLVNAIHASPVWRDSDSRSAIVIVWDENDYSTGIPNQVLVTVDTNFGEHGVKSDHFYTHFSLLKSLEAGFHLPCLNHACDTITDVMSDLFAAKD